MPVLVNRRSSRGQVSSRQLVACSGGRRQLEQSQQWPQQSSRRQRQHGSSARQCGSRSATSSTARRWRRWICQQHYVRDDGASGVRASAVLSLRALAPTRGARLLPRRRCRRRHYSAAAAATTTTPDVNGATTACRPRRLRPRLSSASSSGDSSSDDSSSVSSSRALAVRVASSCACVLCASCVVAC